MLNLTSLAVINNYGKTTKANLHVDSAARYAKFNSFRKVSRKQNNSRYFVCYNADCWESFLFPVPPPTVAAFRPPPAATSRASAPAARPPPRVVSPPSYPPATPLSPPAPKSAPPATKPPTAAPRVATQQPPPPFAENSHPAAPPSRVVPANRDRPAEIDPQEFLPVSVTAFRKHNDKNG